jgi:20S proteasome subunit alpha 7
MSYGFDLSCITLSPDGKLYQVEYAMKAVDQAPTVLGIVCKDGVVFINEKVRTSKAIVPGSNPTVFSITKYIGMTICGKSPDGRALVNRAKQEASSYLKNYGIEISGKFLSERLAMYVQQHTMYGGYRPFGASAMISSYDKKTGFHLYMVEPDGNGYEYYVATQGVRKQYVKTEVEKDNFSIRQKTVKDGLYDFLKIVMKSYEGEKDTEYDISVLSVDNNFEHKLVDRNLIADLSQKAKLQIAEDKKKFIKN